MESVNFWGKKIDSNKNKNKKNGDKKIYFDRKRTPIHFI